MGSDGKAQLFRKGSIRRMEPTRSFETKRSVLLVMAVILGLSGCDRGSQSKIVPMAGEATTQQELNTSPAPTVPASEPSKIATTDSTQHPIDALPQGKEYRKATQALDSGDFEKAEEIRGKLSKDPQYGVLATAVEALALVKKGKHQQAMELAESISEVPVMQGESYAIAGEVFQREGNWNAAIDAFNHSIEINPQHTRAHRWLGIIYYDSGAMRLATEHLRKVADLDTSDVRALFLSGRIHADYEQFQEAVQDFGRLLDRNPPTELEVTARVAMSESLCELRRLEDARSALEGCPEVAAVFATKARIEEAAGNVTAAADFAQSALELNPKNRRARLVLGRMHVGQKEFSEAIEVLQLAVEQHPFDHETRLLFGRSLLAEGDTEKGQMEIERATELKDTFLKFSDLHQDAIKQPFNVDLRLQLGQFAERLGKFEIAKSWYRAVLGLQPDNEMALQAIQKLDQGK